MKYTKPALSFEQQAQRLIDRGLIVHSKEELIQCLKRVNYYRLSAYWYPFKKIDPQTNAETFAPNITFQQIWQRYMFDHELRLLMMDAIEQIEVAILRTKMVEQFTLLHGPFGYCNRANFSPRFEPDSYNQLIFEIQDGVNRSKEEFVTRYRKKYFEEKYLPMWIVTETMTYGQLFTMFNNLHFNEQRKISEQFDLYPPVLVSWLHSINFIRNACAHHARLWNREMPIRPLVPNHRHKTEWHVPILIDNRRIFAGLLIFRYLLRFIDPDSDWKIRFEALLDKYPQVPIHLMGFPKNWKNCPVWI